MLCWMCLLLNCKQKAMHMNCKRLGSKALLNLLQAIAVREKDKYRDGNQHCPPGYSEDDAVCTCFSFVSAGTMFHRL